MGAAAAWAVPAAIGVMQAATGVTKAKRDQSQANFNQNGEGAAFGFKPSDPAPEPADYQGPPSRLNDMVVGAGMTALPGAMASPAMQGSALEQAADAGAQAGFAATAPLPPASQPQAEPFSLGTPQSQPLVKSQFSQGATQPAASAPQAGAAAGKSDLLDNSQKAVGMATSIAGILQNSRPQAAPLQQGSAPQFRPTTQPAQQYDPRLMDYMRRMKGGY